MIESVFELVSSEDQAKMEAAKMQAELAQSQQQKHVSLATDGLPAPSRDSHRHDTPVVSQVSTITSSSQTVSTAENVTTTATVAPFSIRPSLSHSGFTPFAKNPAKQKRYEAYLESVKTGTSCKSVLSLQPFFWGGRLYLVVAYHMHSLCYSMLVLSAS